MKNQYKLMVTQFNVPDWVPRLQFRDSELHPIFVYIEDGNVGTRQVSLQRLVAAYDKLYHIDNGFEK